QERIHRNSRWCEFTLRQVYAELAAYLGWSEEETAEIMAEEYRVESELLRVLPGAHQLIEEMRLRGHQVAFLSDMYLEKDFLWEQLRKHGLCQEGDRCHVSCELGHPKRTGEAFRVMAKLHNVDVRRIIHHGNHPEFDIRGGQRAGAQTRALYEGNPNRFEKILEARVFDTQGLSAVIAGAARLARLSVPAATPEQAVLRDVTAGVVAPALVGYVLWVLQRARRMKLRRLYFLAGGGQVLLGIARRLAPALRIDCELRTLCASYQDGFLPAVETPEARESLLAYFAREGLLDGEPHALVDSGWSGDLVNTLAGIIPGGAECVPPTFCFTRSRPPLDDRGCMNLPYFSNARERQGFLEINPEWLVNILFSAGYAATVEPAGTPAETAAGREGKNVGAHADVVQRTLDAFVENLHLDHSMINVTADARPAIAAVLSALISEPTHAEARVLGSFATRDDVANGRSIPVARPYTVAQIPSCLRSGRIGSQQPSEWIAASVALTPPLLRTVLHAAARAGREARRLARFLARFGSR
ncbi:MAG: hypothetical protein H0X65_00595, partial [Gemmatimonadetes bacterium]|nr:hypothetical protein [Gemmatimonadota bacterium]